METKVCRKCGAEKQHNEFYPRQRKCKECVKLAVRKNRAEKIEYYRQYDKDRFQNDPKVYERHKRYRATEAGKAAMNRARKKSAQKHPERKRASEMVNNAVRDGKLIKPSSCSKCGKTNCRIEGHHPDYSKPLDVTWLCKKCHWKEHEKE